MSLVRFSVAPHETLVDAFYGGLLCLCHVVVFVPLDLFRHESFPRLSACSPTPPGFSCHVVHFVPRKRFNLHQMCVRPCSLYIIPVTFSTDQVPCVLKRFLLTTGRNFRHVVRELGVFTHGKNSHEGGVVALKRHFVLWSARRGWGLWRFASLIPSGWRLPPIHKVMGDHASRGSTPAGLFRRICFCYTHVIYL